MKKKKSKFPESQSFMAEGLKRLLKIRDEAREARAAVQDLAEQIDQVTIEAESAYAGARYWREVEGIDPSHAKVFIRNIHSALLVDALAELGHEYIDKLDQAVVAARSVLPPP